MRRQFPGEFPIPWLPLVLLGLPGLSSQSGADGSALLCLGVRGNPPRGGQGVRPIRVQPSPFAGAHMAAAVAHTNPIRKC